MLNFKKQLKMELGNGIANIRGLFKDPFSDDESDRSDGLPGFVDIPTMEAYRKRICMQGMDDVLEDSELELGEEVEEDRKAGLTKILKKPVLRYEERRPVQSILLEEEEPITRRRSMSPVRSVRMGFESKSTQKGRKKRMSTTSQVFVKQSMLMNSPEKKKAKRTMSVSFQNEEDNKHQRTLDYYSPKKKSVNEEEVSYDDENKITSGILSGNILSNKDSLYDMKTQETQMLNVDDTEKDEQEIIMSPVMSNVMEADDDDKSLNMGDTSEGEIISSLGVSEIFEAVQKDRRESEVLFEDIPPKPKSIKMYIAYHENSMCFYPCVLSKTVDSKCVVKNERLQMDWICKKQDVYYYDLKVDTEVHYDRKIYRIQQRERAIESEDAIIKTDHLDNYAYDLIGVDGRRIKVDVDMIYLDMNDFSKIEDQLMKLQEKNDVVLTKTQERVRNMDNNGLKGFLFQFSDFDKNKEKACVKMILENGGKVIGKNEDIFEDKIKIGDRGKLDIVGLDKKSVPILLIENENYRVTKKLIEFMLLGWPIMRHDVVGRIMEGVDLENNTGDFEEIIHDYQVVKNYDISKFLMNYYGSRNDMFLGSTSLRYVRAFVPKKKMQDDATKFDKITSILLRCDEYKVELNDIKLILFYT